MTMFKITKNLQAVCEWKKTRIAFKHTAILLRDGRDVADTKICYLNRTWEQYEFESVLKKLFDKVKDQLSAHEIKAFKKAIVNGTKYDRDEFRSIAMVAKMGEIFCDDQKAKNDWKARMLKAGLGDNLQMPENWADLSEEEKEKRLNGAIDIIKK